MDRLRFGQLFALLGLTGFALGQPILSLAGENPTLFAYSNVDGWRLVVFALVVALVPPLLLWLAVVAAGLVNRRAGDGVFIGCSIGLAAVALVQVWRAVGLEHTFVVFTLAAVGAAAFGLALIKFETVRAWLRYTAILPALAIGVFLVGSPTSDLLQARGAGADKSESGLPPVVFLMLDEMPTQTLLAPDGTIDRVRFPNIASLADESTWYRNYSVMATWTDVSVPSILSGGEPKTGQALWTDYPDTIFSLFRPTHSLTAVESFTDLCGYPECSASGESGSQTAQPRIRELSTNVRDLWWQRIFPSSSGETDLADFGEEVTETEASTVRGERLTAQQATEDWMRAIRSRPTSAANFVESLSAGDQPSFSYLHLLFPHQPWVHYPDGTRHSAGGQSDRLSTHEVSRADPTWAAAIEEHRYLLQARYTDAVVGEILDRLRETGLYDKAVVVVTSDHGVAFEGTVDSGRAVKRETLPEVAYAPLIIKSPGQREGIVDDSNLLSIDVLPTVAKEVGVEIPWSHPGHAAGSPSVAGRGTEKVIFDFGTDPLRPEYLGVVSFDATMSPRAERRLIGPAAAGETDVAGLVRTIGLADRLGMRVDGIVSGRSGSVAIDDLENLRRPQPGQPAGAVSGNVTADPNPSGERFVLVAVNDEIVTAAPVGGNGYFLTLLPMGALRPEGNEIRVVLVTGGTSTELAVS